MLQGSGGNIGLSVGDDGTLMVDDQFAPLTQKIQAAVRALTPNPVEFVITSTDEPEQMLEYALKLQQRAAESGLFYFPPEIDLKYDQPQTEIVIDRDKVAALGLDNARVGQDLAVHRVAS